MAFSPGIGLSLGHGFAVYVGLSRLILTGPTAWAGSGCPAITVANEEPPTTAKTPAFVVVANQSRLVVEGLWANRCVLLPLVVACDGESCVIRAMVVRNMAG